MRMANRQGGVHLYRCRWSECIMLVTMLLLAVAPVATLFGFVFGMITAASAVIMFVLGYTNLFAEDYLFGFFIRRAFNITDTIYPQWRATRNSLEAQERHREKWSSPGTV